MNYNLIRKTALIIVGSFFITTAQPTGTMEKILYFCGGTGGGFVLGVSVTGVAGLVFAYGCAEILHEKDTKIEKLELRLAKTERDLDNTEILLRTKNGRRLLCNYYKNEDLKKGLTEVLEQEEFSAETSKLRELYSPMLNFRRAKRAGTLSDYYID